MAWVAWEEEVSSDRPAFEALLVWKVKGEVVVFAVRRDEEAAWASASRVKLLPCSQRINAEGLYLLNQL